MKLNRFIVIGCLIAFGCLGEFFDILRQYEHGKVSVGVLITGLIMTPLMLWLSYYLIQKGRKMQKPF